ncbi:hypothetical protein DLAC_02700 [Tieghemostelium lacteum]|uniref:F-box domain-containing protein n=1 Tax=Tieghemostelium lacteum TaxID=361077 RepID=A0A152A366_TIELA|nr:hypothetical protein DLAC_02700 [Tieghemostelium lacteum]|eukprot:KYR00666.1 hypothetical protein DLAC_02700 [Tieghemostelium lacteum]
MLPRYLIIKIFNYLANDKTHFSGFKKFITRLMLVSKEWKQICQEKLDCTIYKNVRDQDTYTRVSSISDKKGMNLELNLNSKTISSYLDPNDALETVIESIVIKDLSLISHIKPSPSLKTINLTIRTRNLAQEIENLETLLNDQVIESISKVVIDLISEKYDMILDLSQLTWLTKINELVINGLTGRDCRIENFIPSLINLESLVLNHVVLNRADQLKDLLVQSTSLRCLFYKNVIIKSGMGVLDVISGISASTSLEQVTISNQTLIPLDSVVNCLNSNRVLKELTVNTNSNADKKVIENSTLQIYNGIGSIYSLWRVTSNLISVNVDSNQSTKEIQYYHSNQCQNLTFRAQQFANISKLFDMGILPKLTYLHLKIDSKLPATNAQVPAPSQSSVTQSLTEFLGLHQNLCDLKIDFRIPFDNLISIIKCVSAVSKLVVNVNGWSINSFIDSLLSNNSLQMFTVNSITLNNTQRETVNIFYQEISRLLEGNTRISHLCLEPPHDNSKVSQETIDTFRQAIQNNCQNLTNLYIIRSESPQKPIIQILDQYLINH